MGADMSFRLDRGETFGEERILSSYLRVILGGREKELEIPVGRFDTAGVHGEVSVKRSRLSFLLLCFVVGGVARGQQPPPQQLPANAAGNWTLYCKDPNGSTSTKYLDLKQDGTVITGHFKGPNQSGGVQGTIEEQHIVVHTKTREVLTFRGRVNGPRVGGVVQGNSINGTFHDRGGTGSFQAVRSN
jgi:hypothetical protein